MNRLIDSVLDTYISAYRGLIATERIDEKNVVLSFPFHIASNHRIEITITDRGGGRYILSDAARTLSEVRAAGYSLTDQMRSRLERIALLSGVRVVEDTIILDVDRSEIGHAIQKFLELSKMIGDVYLVHRQQITEEEDIVNEVRCALNSRGLLYRNNAKVQGEIDSHNFHFYIPPNGHPGLALNVLSGRNTHTVAQVWGFKCEDIKRDERNKNLKLALVYDTRRDSWSEASTSILHNRADIAVSNSELGGLYS